MKQQGVPSLQSAQCSVDALNSQSWWAQFSRGVQPSARAPAVWRVEAGGLLGEAGGGPVTGSVGGSADLGAGGGERGLVGEGRARQVRWGLLAARLWGLALFYSDSSSHSDGICWALRKCQPWFGWRREFGKQELLSLNLTF